MAFTGGRFTSPRNFTMTGGPNTQGRTQDDGQFDNGSQSWPPTDVRKRKFPDTMHQAPMDSNVRRPRYSVGEPMDDDDLQVTDQSRVQLDFFNSDLNLQVEKDGYAASSLIDPPGFCFCWAGARATFGVSRGRVCFEVLITDHLKVDFGDEHQETDPHLLRVGYSTDTGQLQLGEDQESYGYGATGKLSHRGKFTDYGERFRMGDVILAMLDMEAKPPNISFAKNGRWFGVAFPLLNNPAGSRDRAMFPMILAKNVRFEVNFGQRQPWYPLPPGYTYIDHVPISERVRGMQPPPSKNDCEIIMVVGLPGAGKTTWCLETQRRRPEKRYNIIGTDTLIEKMRVMGLPRKNNYHGRWDVLIQKATQCLNILFQIGARRRRNYILDQTNVYASARRRKMSHFEGFRRICAVVQPEDAELERRSWKRTHEDGKFVPADAVLEMKANYSIPDEGEPHIDQVIWVELGRQATQGLVNFYGNQGKNRGGAEPMKAEAPWSGPQEANPKRMRTDLNGGPSAVAEPIKPNFAADKNLPPSGDRTQTAEEEAYNKYYDEWQQYYADYKKYEDEMAKWQKEQEEWVKTQYQGSSAPTSESSSFPSPAMETPGQPIGKGRPQLAPPSGGPALAPTKQEPVDQFNWGKGPPSAAQNFGGPFQGGPPGHQGQRGPMGADAQRGPGAHMEPGGPGNQSGPGRGGLGGPNDANQFPQSGFQPGGPRAALPDRPGNQPHDVPASRPPITSQGPGFALPNSSYIGGKERPSNQGGPNFGPQGQSGAMDNGDRWNRDESNWPPEDRPPRRDDFRTTQPQHGYQGDGHRDEGGGAGGNFNQQGHFDGPNRGPAGAQAWPDEDKPRAWGGEFEHGGGGYREESHSREASFNERPFPGRENRGGPGYDVRGEGGGRGGPEYDRSSFNRDDGYDLSSQGRGGRLDRGRGFDSRGRGGPPGRGGGRSGLDHFGGREEHFDSGYGGGRGPHYDDDRGSDGFNHGGRHPTPDGYLPGGEGADAETRDRVGGRGGRFDRGRGGGDRPFQPVHPVGMFGGRGGEPRGPPGGIFRGGPRGNGGPMPMAPRGPPGFGRGAPPGLLPSGYNTDSILGPPPAQSLLGAPPRPPIAPMGGPPPGYPRYDRDRGDRGSNRDGRQDDRNDRNDNRRDRDRRDEPHHQQSRDNRRDDRGGNRGSRRGSRDRDRNNRPRDSSRRDDRSRDSRRDDNSRSRSESKNESSVGDKDGEKKDKGDDRRKEGGRGRWWEKDRHERRGRSRDRNSSRNRHRDEKSEKSDSGNSNKDATAEKKNEDTKDEKLSAPETKPTSVEIPPEKTADESADSAPTSSSKEAAESTEVKSETKPEVKEEEKKSAEKDGKSDGEAKKKDESSSRERRSDRDRDRDRNRDRDRDRGRGRRDGGRNTSNDRDRNRNRDRRDSRPARHRRDDSRDRGRGNDRGRDRHDNQQHPPSLLDQPMPDMLSGGPMDHGARPLLRAPMMGGLRGPVGPPGFMAARMGPPPGGPRGPPMMMRPGMRPGMMNPRSMGPRGPMPPRGGPPGQMRGSRPMMRGAW